MVNAKTLILLFAVVFLQSLSSSQAGNINGDHQHSGGNADCSSNKNEVTNGGHSRENHGKHLLHGLFGGKHRFGASRLDGDRVIYHSGEKKQRGGALPCKKPKKTHSKEVRVHGDSSASEEDGKKRKQFKSIIEKGLSLGKGLFQKVKSHKASRSSEQKNRSKERKRHGGSHSSEEKHHSKERRPHHGSSKKKHPCKKSARHHSSSEEKHHPTRPTRKTRKTRKTSATTTTCSTIPETTTACSTTPETTTECSTTPETTTECSTTPETTTECSTTPEATTECSTTPETTTEC